MLPGRGAVQLQEGRLMEPRDEVELRIQGLHGVAGPLHGACSASGSASGVGLGFGIGCRLRANSSTMIVACVLSCRQWAKICRSFSKGMLSELQVNRSWAWLSAVCESW